MRRLFSAVFLFAGLVQTGFAFEDELKFVAGLTQGGFPDLAKIVLNRTLRDYPEAGKSAPELRIRILIAEKKFDEAQTQIAALNDSAQLWLFLAETAYRARQLPAAEAAYKKYFETGAKTDAAVFQAAYNYGGLLEERSDQNAAEKLYEQVLNLPDAGKNARPVKVKLARLLAEKNQERAKKLCEEVQLGGLDLWFGQAVVTWSNVMQSKGDWDEVTAVLETQLELLRQLEGALEKQKQPVSLISPLAGARYLLGLCYARADKKTEALQQFYNVYVQYGDSEWGPDAQERALALIAGFKEQGRTVKIELGANAAKMEASRFRVARRHFSDEQYTAAVPAYLDALTKYPEGGEAVAALRELVQCYIQLNDTHSAKAVAGYIGERFTARETAADALLAAGKCALDVKQNSLAWWMYDRYLDCFPADSRAPGVLYSLSALRKQTGDDSGEEDCLNRILQNYPNNLYAVRALGRLAWNSYEKEDYKTAASRFEQVVNTESDPEKQMRARFALAESYRLSGAWRKSVEHFKALESSLTAAAESFGVSDETLALNKPFLEKSIFYQGTCLVKRGETDEAVPAFERFITTFPESEFIPQARLAKSSALMDLKKYDEALAALAEFDERSDRKYLESALYYRGQAFFATGRYNESIQSFETLLSNWPESAFFFEAKLAQGRAYAAAGQSSDAVRVLSDVLNFASDDLLIHRASLALGRAQTDPAEKLASFQRVALLADPAQPGQAPLIAEALHESLSLYRELNRPQDLLADSLRLINEFPMFGKNGEVRMLCATAREDLSKKDITADSAD